MIVRCQPALRRLLEECAREDCLGADVISSNEAEPTEFDWHLPLASLPGLLGVTIADVGRSVPYLHPPEMSPPLTRLIGERDAARWVGLVWQGNPRQTRDIVRSCPLEKLRPLIELPDIRFFSLQYGEAAVRSWRRRSRRAAWWTLAEGWQTLPIRQPSSVSSIC